MLCKQVSSTKTSCTGTHLKYALTLLLAASFAACKQFRRRLGTTERLIYNRSESTHRGGTTSRAKRLVGAKRPGENDQEGKVLGAKRLGEEMV